MSVLNLLLDLAGLLLWLGWRAMAFRQAVAYRTSLAHTLRSAEPGRPRRWPHLAGLFALLLLRAPLYGQLGPALLWVPQLDLSVMSLRFRSDQPWRMLTFSFLSFLLTLGIGYLWLLLPSLINRNLPDTQPVQTMVRAHLGRFDRWPWFLKLLLPLLSANVVWMALHPLLLGLGLVPPASAPGLVVQQGAVLGLAIFLSWRPLLLGLLFLYVLNSYVYLGRSPFWDFINGTGKNLLRPLQWLPLRLGRIDFAPALAAVLIWYIAEFSARGLEQLFRQLPLF